MSKELKSFAGLKAGDKIKVVGNSNSHNYEVGKVYTLSSKGTAAQMTNPFKETRGGNTISARDCEIYSLLKVADMLAEIKDLEKQISDIQGKINLCTELGLVEYDETYITVHKTLQILKGDASDTEKTRIIVDLLKKMQ